MNVIIYILALAAYCGLGGFFITFGKVMTMDIGPGLGSWIYFAVIASLWVAGLWFGTTAYF